MSHKSEDYKINAVEYYLDNDFTQQEVCNIFKCSVRSLLRWMELYEGNDNIKRQSRPSIAYKVYQKHVKFLLTEIDKNKTITMNELMVKLQNKFNITLSRFHINRIINDNNITLKMARVRHEPIKRFGKDININDNLKIFYDEIKKYKLKDIICIDETSISSSLHRNNCYSKLGKRCIIKTQSQEVFKKYTGIFAISIDGILGWELYEKCGIDSIRLATFLEKFITKKYKKKLIILDNASSHRNAKIKELINKDNTVLYSIPYQHYTNAIENYFSMLKSRLRKLTGLKHEELKKNISIVIKEIPKENYKNILEGTYKRPNIYVKATSNRLKEPKTYKK